jgi:hypothetical protein
LSSRVLTGLLRDSLSYDGVVITDAMDMAGVLRQFGAPEAARRTDLGAGVGFNGEMRRGFDSVRAEFVSSDDAAPNFERLLRLADSSDVTIVGSYVNISSTTASAGAPRAFLDFVTQLRARHPRTVLVSFGTPYLLQQAPTVSAYMIAWGPSQASQLAAAHALLGSAAITGVLPISLPPYASLGSGEQRAAVRRGPE